MSERIRKTTKKDEEYLREVLREKTKARNRQIRKKQVKIKNIGSPLTHVVRKRGR